MPIGNFIAKIEGHGSLTVDWRKETIRLNIHEGERLFEGLLVGRTAEEMRWITPRICGVCPIAHNLASLNALENALKIKPARITVLLRDLMRCGQMIQSHVLHLFFLAAPDYLGLDRATELAKKDPKLFKQILSLKEIGDEIAHQIGGRNIHPTKTAIGGFYKFPSQADLNKLLKKLEKTKKAAQKAVQVFLSFEYPKLKVDLELAAIVKDKIISVNSLNGGRKISLVKNYQKDIREEIRDYSTAKFSKYQGKELLVGALARLAVGETKTMAKKYQIDFSNPFHNNLAQAIEILYYRRKAKKIIEKLIDLKLTGKPANGSLKGALKGIGAIEAPRGGLYHEVHLKKNLDNDLIIDYANIITPTAQNLTSIEKSAQALLEQTTGYSKEKREKLLTMLVRAYDPCITCSVH